MEQKDSGILQGGINVVVSKAPILSPIFEVVDNGLSLRDIFNRYTGLSEHYTKIFVSGDEVLDWSYVPNDGVSVSVCQTPKGSGEDWLTAATFGFPVFAIANIGVIGGYALYTMIDQPATSQGEQLKRVTGAKNEAKPYEPIPFILGERRVVPSYAAQPYTYWQGDQQYLKMLLCVGYGPLSITDIKIGDTPIRKFRDVEYAVLDWRYTLSTSSIRRIWNADVQQDAVNQELGRSNYISRGAPAGTSKIRLDYIYPQGLWRTDDGDTAHTVSGVQMRFYANGFWYSIAKVHYSPNGHVVTQSLVKIDGRYYITREASNTGGSWPYGSRYDVTDYVVLEKDGLAYIKDGYGGRYKYVNTTTHWEGTRDQLNFSFSWRPIDPVTGNPLTENVPIQVKRLGFDYDPDGSAFGTTAQLNSITYELGDDFLTDSYFGVDKDKNQYPVLIALDIRATEQLSGVIDNLSCKAKTLIPERYILDDYKNFSIRTDIWHTTNNPAELYKWALQGPFNGAAVENDRIDNWALDRWYNECAVRGWECNEIVNYEINLKSLLNNIAFTGRAFFSMQEGKFGVVENRAKENPTQVFTIKNSSGLKSRREFAIETDGIKYTFANADFEDQEDEGYYGDPNKFKAADIERPFPNAKITGSYDTMEIWGTTDPTLARKHARFAYYENVLRREIYSLETDIESLVARRGDKVLIASDIIDVGLGQGFVKQVGGSMFKIDETINLTAGRSYALTFRSVSSGVNINTYTFRYDGDGWWNGTLPAAIDVGDLVMYGEVGKESLECLVQEITYSDNFKANLTLVNYAGEIYELNDQYIPEYKSGLTPNRKRDITPAAPVITVNDGISSFESNAITVSVTQAVNDRARLSRFSLQYRYTTDEVDFTEESRSWIDGGVSDASSGKFNIPINNSQGNIIEVRATAVNEAGVHGPLSEVETITLQDGPAADVVSFTVTEEVNKPKTPDAIWSTLTIKVVPPEDKYGYLYSIAEYRQPGQEDYQVIGKVGWKDSNEIDVQVYADGRQYEVRVRSVSIFGVTNKYGLSKIITTTNTSDPKYTEDNPFYTLPAPNVKGLELFEQGNDTEFGGKEAKFTWRKSTLADWVEIGYEGLKGASSSVLDQYFRDYQIDIIADNETVRVENTVDNFYTYTYEKNAEDYERRYGVPGAYREFRVSVVMRTRQNQESAKPATLDASNTPPQELQGLVVYPGFNVIEISYKRPTDLDFAGVDIWIETTSGFDPDVTAPVATISDNSFVAGGLAQDTVYYVRLRPFDVFGRTGTNTTSEIAVTTKTGQDLTGLSGWAYEIDPVDRTFIENNLAGDAVPSEKIENLTAAKLTAGVINATGGITTESIFRAVDDINNPQYQAGVGPLLIDGTTYLTWGYDANAVPGSKLKFGIDELGNAIFNGGGSFSGTVAIAKGSSGVANLSDAGALAELSSVGDSEITFKYAVSTAKGGNAINTDNVGDTTSTDVEDGVSRAQSGLDTSGNVTTVIQGSKLPTGVSNAVGGELLATNTYLGWHNGNGLASGWQTYIKSDGQFHFGDADSGLATDNFIDYNGTILAIKTNDLVIDTTQFSLDADGNASFGGNLNAAGGKFTGTLEGVDGTFSGTLAADTISFENVIAGSFNYLDTKTEVLSSSDVSNGTNIKFDVGEYKRIQSFKASISISQIAGRIYAPNNSNTKRFTREVRWNDGASASTGEYIFDRTVEYPSNEEVTIYKAGDTVWSGSFAKTVGLTSERYITIHIEGDTYNTEIDTDTEWEANVSIDISFI